MVINKTGSATTELVNELGHSWGNFFKPEQKFTSSEIVDSQYKNLEERYVMGTYEHQVAKYLGEWVRLKYGGGNFFQTISIYSKDPLTKVPSRIEHKIVTIESQLGQSTTVEIN